jgi:hypothetical protein
MAKIKLCPNSIGTNLRLLIDGPLELLTAFVDDGLDSIIVIAVHHGLGSLTPCLPLSIAEVDGARESAMRLTVKAGWKFISNFGQEIASHVGDVAG